jgi:hypothetical protein
MTIVSRLRPGLTSQECRLIHASTHALLSGDTNGFVDVSQGDEVMHRVLAGELSSKCIRTLMLVSWLVFQYFLRLLHVTYFHKDVF